MPRLSWIASDQTVRQVASAFPACAEELGRWPGTRRGDRWTLQQLGPLARQLHLDEREFLGALSEKAGVPLRLKHPAPRRTGSPLPLIFTALIVGIGLGTSFGVGLLWRIAAGSAYNAVSGASIHVHGVAELWGWMTLFIFGVGTHLLRQNTTRPAPRWIEFSAAGCILVGLLAFFAGLSPRVQQHVPIIDIIGSSFLALSAVLFGVVVVWSLSGAASNQRRHGLMFLVGWVLAWAASDLFLRIANRGDTVLPDSARTLLIVLPVLGFATNAIFGFGIRLIPGLLNIGHLRQRWFAAALMSYNTGLVLFLIPVRLTGILGAVMMLCGSICYLAGMDFLRSRPSRPIYGIDPRGHILIRAAFGWLVIALVMILIQQIDPALPHPFQGAWRHALTVGFITTMILGVGYRIVPIFIRQPLASTALMLVSAWLILIGNAGRVTLELLTIGGWTWSFHLMGITGLLELTALILFGLDLAATAINRRRIYAPDRPLTPDTRIQEAINVHPEIQERLDDLGITMFDSAAFVAPSMTFGALAMTSGREPHQLIRDLELQAQIA